MHGSEESDESSIRSKVDPATRCEIDTRRMNSGGSAVCESTHRSILRVDDEKFGIHRCSETSHDCSRIFRVGVEVVRNSNETSARFAVFCRDELTTFRIGDRDEAGIDQEREELLTKFLDLLQILL